MHPIIRDAIHDSVTIDGQPVHWVDYGTTAAEPCPVYVLVHGLGGSHLNWDLLAPELAAHGYVLSLDLRGFGRTEPHGLPADVHSNVAVLEDFLRIVCHGDPVVLVGNSMGGMISALLAEACPDLVEGVVLLDPALPLPVPPVGPLAPLVASTYLFGLEKLLGVFGGLLTPEHRARTVMAACGVDGATLPEWFVQRAADLMAERKDEEAMEAALFQAARSCTSLMLQPGVYRKTLAAIQAPVLLVHGDRDRIVPVRAAREAARRFPDWTYVELDGVGHVPQIESPRELAALITAWSDVVI